MATKLDKTIKAVDMASMQLEDLSKQHRVTLLYNVKKRNLDMEAGKVYYKKDLATLLMNYLSEEAEGMDTTFYPDDKSFKECYQKLNSKYTSGLEIRFDKENDKYSLGHGGDETGEEESSEEENEETKGAGDGPVPGSGPGDEEGPGDGKKDEKLITDDESKKSEKPGKPGKSESGKSEKSDTQKLLEQNEEWLKRFEAMSMKSQGSASSKNTAASNAQLGEAGNPSGFNPMGWFQMMTNPFSNFMNPFMFMQSNPQMAAQIAQSMSSSSNGTPQMNMGQQFGSPNPSTQFFTPPPPQNSNPILKNQYQPGAVNFAQQQVGSNSSTSPSKQYCLEQARHNLRLTSEARFIDKHPWLFHWAHAGISEMPKDLNKIDPIDMIRLINRWKPNKVSMEKIRMGFHENKEFWQKEALEWAIWKCRKVHLERGILAKMVNMIDADFTVPGQIVKVEGVNLMFSDLVAESQVSSNARSNAGGSGRGNNQRNDRNDRNRNINERKLACDKFNEGRSCSYGKDCIYPHVCKKCWRESNKKLDHPSRDCPNSGSQ